MSKALAQISVDGLLAWGIELITRPVTFGRFARDTALTFANIDRTEGHKHDYMYLMLLNKPPPPPTQKFPYPGGVIKFSISCVFSPKKIFRFAEFSLIQGWGVY